MYTIWTEDDAGTVLCGKLPPSKRVGATLVQKMEREGVTFEYVLLEGSLEPEYWDFEDWVDLLVDKGGGRSLAEHVKVFGALIVNAGAACVYELTLLRENPRRDFVECWRVTDRAVADRGVPDRRAELYGVLERRGKPHLPT